MSRGGLSCEVHWQRLRAKRKGRAGEQRSADVRGLVAATASEGEEARGLSGVRGWPLGLRVLGQLAARWRGCAGGPRSWAARPGLRVLLPFFFSFLFSIFFFLSFVLNLV